MKVEESLNLLGRRNKVIYFADKDIELIKRIGKQLEENFPEFEIVGMIKLEDVEDELKNNPPMVMIIDIELAPEDSMRGFFEKLRNNELYKKLPVVVTGPRMLLEQNSILIDRFELEIVPKSIRVPYMMAVISSGIRQASTIQSRLIELKSEDYLFREGEKGDTIYVLREGQLDVVKLLDGKEVQIGHISDQQMIGELAYLEKKLRTASVRARTDCKILELQLGDVDQFLEMQPYWLKLMLTTLVDRVRESNKHIIDLERRLQESK